MGMGDTSAYQDFTGNSDADQIHTPQMERLARMGVRFTDAHTPSSRCSPTRYGLLTGRYPWRNRLKFWVLFGSQGDPMIEADRPTLATMLRDTGYRTAMVGKWHVGLRYRRSDGSPAAGWEDADLAQPLQTTPLDHGFDFCRFTSRSHGTSGPDAGRKAAPAPKNPKKGKGKGNRNTPTQSIGPGHIHGRTAVGATGDGKKLVDEGPDAYVLTELGGRHSDHAIGFLDDHLSKKTTRGKPFFLYYPSNSNHGPHTPDTDIAGQPVAGAGRSVAGEKMNVRADYIYENDVALGRLLDYLEATEDPRDPGKKLAESTLVIFTSDNGAEINSDIATGPFRSHKGSCYEGGHRVPFMVAWGPGGIGDGDATTAGVTSDAPIGLQDMFATFADLLGRELPDLRAGEKGAEDSFSVLAAFRGEPMPERPPLFFNDHSEAKDDPAVVAMRLDNPSVEGQEFEGKWKVFFDAALVRAGRANPFELYDLATDSRETTNRVGDPELKPLVQQLTRRALLLRNSGGHRVAEFAPRKRVVFEWGDAMKESGDRAGLEMTVRGFRGDEAVETKSLRAGSRGPWLDGGDFQQIDGGEAVVLQFDRDVVVESVAVIAGEDGVCGGFYQVADSAPLAIYCVDADNDAKDQSGILSDIGVLKAGETLRLDSSPHFGVEAAGRWKLGAITVRVLE